MISKEFSGAAVNGPRTVAVTPGPYGSQFLLIVQAQFAEGGTPSIDPFWQLDLSVDQPAFGFGSVQHQASIVFDGVPEHSSADFVLPIVAPAGFPSLAIVATPNDTDFAYKIRVWVVDLGSSGDITVS